MDRPSLERRSEPRLAANEPVVVTELGQPQLHPKGGLIVEISGSNLTLKLPSAIPLGTPVKVETNDLLMLGEVMRCEPEGDGFRLGLQLRHALRDLPALEKLNRALRGEEEAAREEPAPVHIMKK